MSMHASNKISTYITKLLCIFPMLSQNVHLEIKCYFVVFVIKIGSAFLQMIVIHTCGVDLENDIYGVWSSSLQHLFAFGVCEGNIEQSHVYSEYCSILSAVIPATKRWFTVLPRYYLCFAWCLIIYLANTINRPVPHWPCIGHERMSYLIHSVSLPSTFSVLHEQV